MLKIHIAVLLMVKNETMCLRKTLDSVVGFADSIVAFDTGSTDNTVQILKDFSEETKIPLRLKIGEFVDFSTSRNVSLDFADSHKEIDYILLLDCNDELRSGNVLREFCNNMVGSQSTGFLISQEWWNGTLNKYFNIRLVKAHKQWRYKGSVHEWMQNQGLKEGEKEPQVLKIPVEAFLYQDKTNDDDKTSHRFQRDKILLMADHKKDPSNPRTVFYLAQTCSCLGDNEDALYYYKMRATMDGFQEEKFHAYLRAGDVSLMLGHSWDDTMKWYMNACEHSTRAEPIIKIAEHYASKHKWLLSFTFSELACRMKYPEYCLLFVDKLAYDYQRWHQMGISGYHAGFMEHGKAACQKALEHGHNACLDRRNLEWYEKNKVVTRS
jgi:glycosyltransferase involved in cell wall biosynthesis